MNSLYLQDRVNSIVRKRANTRIDDIQTAVDNQIFEESLLPANQKLLAKDVAQERKKAETKSRKEKKAEKNRELEEPDTEIVTLLLVFKKTDTEAEAEEKKKKKKKTSHALFCMTLWADGVAVNPVQQFKKTSLLREYRYAVDRKSLPLSECGCMYCQPADVASRDEVHFTWHEKFRSYFALRAEQYPHCKDFIVTLTPSHETLLMYHLMLLWKKVDPELSYFSTAACLDYEKEAKASVEAFERKQAAAKRAAEKKAVAKALKATSKPATGLWGIRIPREYKTYASGSTLATCTLRFYVLSAFRTIKPNLFR